MSRKKRPEEKYPRNPHCAGCQYRNRDGMHVCDYFSIMADTFPKMKDHRRGCSIEECEHWKDPVLRLRGGTTFINRPNVRKMERNSERTEAMLKLHRDGMTDTQIAEAVGVSRETVRKWRYKSGLANNEKGALKE